MSVCPSICLGAVETYFFTELYSFRIYSSMWRSQFAVNGKIVKYSALYSFRVLYALVNRSSFHLFCCIAFIRFVWLALTVSLSLSLSFSRLHVSRLPTRECAQWMHQIYNSFRRNKYPRAGKIFEIRQRCYHYTINYTSFNA